MSDFAGLNDTNDQVSTLVFNENPDDQSYSLSVID